MRFGIKYLLILTVVAAVVGMAVQSHFQVRQTKQAVELAKAELVATLSGIDAEKAAIRGSEQRLDYYEQVNLVHQTAMDSFDELVNKYGAVEPQPGKIGLRQLLVLKEDAEQSVWAYRIAVPKEFPVFLRSGVTIANSVESRARNRLDTQAWVANVCLQDAEKHSRKLKPGIHTLVIKGRRATDASESTTLQVTLDDQPLLNTKTIDEKCRSSSSSSIAPKTQYNFDFERRETMRLVRIDYEKEGATLNHEFWIWLSGQEDAEGFTPYPVAKNPEANSD